MQCYVDCKSQSGGFVCVKRSVLLDFNIHIYISSSTDPEGSSNYLKGSSSADPEGSSSYQEEESTILDQQQIASRSAITTTIPPLTTSGTSIAPASQTTSGSLKQIKPNTRYTGQWSEEHQHTHQNQSAANYVIQKKQRF